MNKFNRYVKLKGIKFLFERTYLSFNCKDTRYMPKWVHISIVKNGFFSIKKYYVNGIRVPKNNPFKYTKISILELIDFEKAKHKESIDRFIKQFNLNKPFKGIITIDSIRAYNHKLTEKEMDGLYK